MPGLEPGIHAAPLTRCGVDGRDKPGHDAGEDWEAFDHLHAPDDHGKNAAELEPAPSPDPVEKFRREEQEAAD